MKQIIAYIKPAVLELVTEALMHVEGLNGMSVMDVSGFGLGRCEVTRPNSGLNTLFKRNVRLEIMTSDAVVWEVVDTIRQKAWPGEQGKVQLYVLDVVEAMRIPANERGEAVVWLMNL